MDAIQLPLLSSKGSPKTQSELLDWLLADALAADYSQSTLFYGKITSIPYIVATNSNRPTILMTAIRDRLEDYLERFFTSLSVEVNEMAIPGLNPDGNRYGLQIAITAIAASGERVNLAQGFSVGQGVMSKIGNQD